MKTSEVTKEDTSYSNRYREVALPIAALVEKLDMPEENIATFMCYLEVGQQYTMHLPILCCYRKVSKHFICITYAMSGAFAELSEWESELLVLTNCL